MNEFFARNKRYLALIIAIALAIALGIVQGLRSQTEIVHSSQQQTVDLGNVQIFLPSDGDFFKSVTPINTWSNFSHDLQNALEHQGFNAEHVALTTSVTLEEQAVSLHNTVRKLIDKQQHSTAESHNAKKNANVPPSPTTLIISPVVPTSSVTQQYGNLLSTSLNHADADSDDWVTRLADLFSDSHEKIAHYETMLENALTQAQKHNIRVMLIGHPIGNITPDIYVKTFNAYEIGEYQARMLVEKLDIRLPKDVVVSSTSQHDNQNAATHEHAAITPEQVKKVEIFVPDDHNVHIDQQVFAGMLNVLKPYITAGYIVSPSGLLTSETTEADWQHFIIPATSVRSIESAVAERLHINVGFLNFGNDITPVDGIIATNDYVASGVVAALHDAGYKGTGASINPDITVTSIERGNSAAIEKQNPPTPNIKNMTDTSDATNQDATKQWPIVTGFGAYSSSLSDIVSGRQWITGLNDRKTLVQQIAAVCKIYGIHGIVTHSAYHIDEHYVLQNSEFEEWYKPLQYSQRQLQQHLMQHNNTIALPYITMNKKQVVVLTSPVLPITSHTLKPYLIDSRYITAADAGL